MNLHGVLITSATVFVKCVCHIGAILMVSKWTQHKLCVHFVHRECRYAVEGTGALVRTVQVMIWCKMIWYDLVWNMIWYDIIYMIWYIRYNIWYDVIWFGMIYDIFNCTCVATRLKFFSTHTHTHTHTHTRKQYRERHKTNNTLNNIKIRRTTQKLGRVRVVPRLCGFCPRICLTTEEKARKTLSQSSHT
jgi:phosphatidylserine synthase